MVFTRHFGKQVLSKRIEKNMQCKRKWTRSITIDRYFTIKGGKSRRHSNLKHTCIQLLSFKMYEAKFWAKRVTWRLLNSTPMATPNWQLHMK